MEAQPQRPQHRRHASSKSNLLKALVPSSKARAENTEHSVIANQQTRKVPILAQDDSPSKKPSALGERQSNVQSPPASPTKGRHKSKDSNNGSSKDVKKSKSTTNLSAVFSRLNRSSKDLTAAGPKDKENSVPQRTNEGPVEARIWAQFATTQSTAQDKDEGQLTVGDDGTKHKPSAYPPRSFEQPSLKPRAATNVQGSVSNMMLTNLGRAISGGKDSSGYNSAEIGSKDRPVQSSGVFGLFQADRKTSGSSTEQAPAKEKLDITKRGGRVMAAVAAFQGKNTTALAKGEAPLDPKSVDEAFEAVLDSRNIPEAMRQKMRSLTLRVKADFIRQDQGSKDLSPPGSSDNNSVAFPTAQENLAGAEQVQQEDGSKSTKRSRPRSRTFTWSKNKRNDESPQKKPRSQSRSRPTTIIVGKDVSVDKTSTTPTSVGFGSLGRKTAPAAVPADYITYLKKDQDPLKTEIGRLHKLRILLRNETVTWVDNFVSLGGLKEIVGLLYRIMAIEWREEHEDQLLNETLLCLKGLCTTEMALAELEKIADSLFPALLGMLFDEERKGPAEYSTRTIIINVLFNYLSSTTQASGAVLEQRARDILRYLGEPPKPESDRPVEFVLSMHVPRPYRLWSREVSNVTKEVFWIFLHHLNVVPLPKRKTNGDCEDEEEVLGLTYMQRHFPGTRPPVPAAPYIGGVEWDATTYLTAHLDLVNGLVASLASGEDRNQLRGDLQASGFEKVMGSTLRTCKEKFYGGVHDGLRSWVAAAAEDGWDTQYVREGPTMDEQAARARSASPKKSPKKKDEAPKIEAPKLDLGFTVGDATAGDDDAWLG